MTKIRHFCGLLRENGRIVVFKFKEFARFHLPGLAGLLLGAAFAGATAFNGTPALAQSADGNGDDVAGEVETNDAEDANEGPDVPITGDALDQASAAALDYIGEGRVTETEVGDEEGYYEVEITKDNGREVDVHLDEAFNVLGHEND